MPDEPKTKKKRARRGSGCLFQKTPGGVWHIQYYGPSPKTGKLSCIKEYISQPNKSDAQKILSLRLTQVARGESFDIGRRRATVATLYDNLRVATENSSGAKSRKVHDIGVRWAHLKLSFSCLLAANVTSALIEDYKRKRLDEGAANATINRELATLRRMFRFGKQSTPPSVRDVPYIRMLPENNVRTGFVEGHQYKRLAEEAAKDGLWMRLLLEAAYAYGWRRGELLKLRVRQVDLRNCTLRLDPGTTKNKKGREVTIKGSLMELFKAACTDKEPGDAVFTRDDGSPVLEFRGAWWNLCVRAGVGEYRCADCDAAWTGKRCECGGRKRKYKGLIVHDMRRSAARRMRTSGTQENVIMAIGGWKTRSMFDRYAIVNNDDTRRAMEALEALEALDALKALKASEAANQQLNPSITPLEENSDRSGMDEKGGTIQ